MSDKPDQIWVGMEPWWSTDRDTLLDPTRYIRADLEAERDAEIEKLNARISELVALVGTVRDITGCQVRNVHDIGVEQHSREIAAEIDRLRADNATLRAHIERWSYAGSLPPPTGEKP